MSENAGQAKPHVHQVPLWALFLLLVGLTAGEVGFYELWIHSAEGGEPFMPKIAMVLVMLLVLTLPKAVIVLTYFMHLKFEKQIILAMALVPLIFVPLAVLPTLADAVAHRDEAYNQVEDLGEYQGHPHGEEAGHAEDAHAEEPAPGAEVPGAMEAAGQESTPADEAETYDSGDPYGY